MIISMYFCYFMLFSFLGWVWETIYVTVREKKFANRGFLFGPICPIYGSLIVPVMIIFRYVPALSAGQMPVWGIFLCGFFGTSLIEFTTSYYLEKRFHMRWWDYSDIPLNIQGRISVPTSAGFGLGGIVIVKVILPWMAQQEAGIHPLVFEGVSLGLAILFGGDFALTEASLNRLLVRIQDAEKQFMEKGEIVFRAVSHSPELIREKMLELEKELTEGSLLTVSTLNFSDKHILGKVKRFVPDRKSGSSVSVGEKLKEAVNEKKKQAKEEKNTEK